MQEKNRFTYRTCFIAVSVALSLAACGGGGNSEPTTPIATPVPAPASALNGTAAGGAPIIGASVIVKDAKGNTSTAVTTNADGSYTVATSAMANLLPPLIIKVSGGTVNGKANTQDLFSLSTSGGVANITPLTSLLVASISGQNPADLFSDLGSKVTSLDKVVTTANVSKATTAVLAELTARGMDVSKLENPLTATIKAGDPANVNDQFLDQMKVAIPSLTELLSTVATTAVVTNGGTSPTGGTSITASLTDDTFGGCMALAKLPDGISVIDVGANLPEVKARYAYTSYKMADIDSASGTPTWGVDREATLNEFASKSGKWKNETGEIDAILTPYKLIVHRQVNIVNKTPDERAWSLDLIDANSLIGRQFLGYREFGTGKNPSDLGIGSNYKFGFYYDSSATSETNRDGLKKGVLVEGRAGKRYDDNDKSKTATLSSKISYNGLTDLTTKLGAMKACKVTSTGTLTKSDGASVTFTETTWTAPKLGVVRRDYSETGYNAAKVKNWESSQSRELLGKMLGSKNYGTSLAPDDSTYGSCLKTVAIPALAGVSTSLANQLQHTYTNYFQGGFNTSTGAKTSLQTREGFINVFPALVDGTFKTFGPKPDGSGNGTYAIPAKKDSFSLTVTKETLLDGSSVPAWKIEGNGYYDPKSEAFIGWEERGVPTNPASWTNTYFMRGFGSQAWGVTPAIWYEGLPKGKVVSARPGDGYIDWYTEADWITGTKWVKRTVTAQYVGKEAVMTPFGEVMACRVDSVTTDKSLNQNVVTSTSIETERSWNVGGMEIKKEVSQIDSDAVGKTWEAARNRQLTSFVKDGKLYGAMK